MKLKMIAAICSLLLASSAVLYAADADHPSGHQMVTVGDLEFHHPWLRATLPNAKVAAGYMLIRNTGDETITLTGGDVAFAEIVEVHTMVLQNDVMRMRPLSDGLEIPAGGEVTLEPGSHHLMLKGLAQALKAGEMQRITLSFDGTAEVTLDLPVQPIGYEAPHGEGHAHGEGHEDKHQHGSDKSD